MAQIDPTEIRIPQNFCKIDFVSEMKQYVVPELPEVPIPLMDRVIRDKVIHFCNETEFWVYQLQPMKIIKDVVDYIMTTDLGDLVQINKISLVFQENRQINAGIDYILNNKTIIRLTHKPPRDMQNGLLIFVSLRPARNKNIIDERIFDDYYDAWKFGIISDLARMSGKTWTDKRLSLDYDRLYWDGIRRARADIFNLGVSANAQVKLGNFTLQNFIPDGRAAKPQNSFF